MRVEALLALLPVVLAVPSVKRDEPAPLIIPRDAEALVADHYIVKLKDSSEASALDDSLSLLAKDADHVYTEAFRGFAATLDKKTLELLRDQPDVRTSAVVKLSTMLIRGRLTTSSRTPP